jgi:2-methylcitrate dehydratase
MKAYPTEALTHAPVSCVLRLCVENGLAPDDIESITIRSTARAADILADPSKYEPDSKETADHSLPYIVAAAVVDHNVTPLQFTDEKIHDPAIRAVIPRVKVLADDECERLFPDVQRNYVAIGTRDGRSIEGSVDFPKGDPRDPMTDAEVEAKYRALAEMGEVDGGRQDAILAAVAGLDGAESLAELMGLLGG